MWFPKIFLRFISTANTGDCTRSFGHGLCLVGELTSIVQWTVKLTKSANREYQMPTTKGVHSCRQHRGKPRWGIEPNITLPRAFIASLSLVRGLMSEGHAQGLLKVTYPSKLWCKVGQLSSKVGNPGSLKRETKV